MAMIGKDIEYAASLLKAGELVGMPTETVYGLAANGLDEAAVLRIFTAKQRPHFDPLILHVDTLDKVAPLVVDIPPKAHALAEAFWPGPLTLLLEKTAQVPDLVTSGLSRVALRIPAHPLTRSLLERLPFPLAAPSANPFGYVSPTCADHVDRQLGETLGYILDGGTCRIGVESTILGFENGEPVVHRLGGIELEAIEGVVGRLQESLNQNDNPAAPGMISSHYAPGKPLLLGDIPALLKQHRDKRLGIISFRDRYPEQVCIAQYQLAPTGHVGEAAHELFAALRYFEDLDVDLILAEPVPDEGLGRAVNDRLRRASVRRGEGL